MEKRLARRRRSPDHPADCRGVGEVRAAKAVRPEGYPSRARSGGREPVGKKRGEVPRAVASHRVAGEVDAVPIDPEALRRAIERLERVETPPFLPVEAVGAPVRRRDHVRPGFRRVGRSLIQRFDRRAVEGKDERLRAALPRGGAGRRRARRIDRVILDASVDGAHEGLPADFAGLDDPQIERDFIQLLEVGAAVPVQRDLEGGGAGGLPRRALEGEPDLPHRELFDERRVRLRLGASRDPRANDEPAERLRRRVDDDDRSVGPDLLPCDEIRQRGVAPVQEHRLRRRVELRLEGAAGAAEKKLVPPLLEIDRKERVIEIRLPRFALVREAVRVSRARRAVHVHHLVPPRPEDHHRSTLRVEGRPQVTALENVAREPSPIAGGHGAPLGRGSVRPDGGLPRERGLPEPESESRLDGIGGDDDLGVAFGHGERETVAKNCGARYL